MLPVSQFLSVPESPPLKPLKPGAMLLKPAGPDPKKIAETAKEFEATFLSLLLKEMRQTLEPGGLFEGDSGDVQGGLFDLFMGKHLADSGGVGFGSAIERHLRYQAHVPPARPSVGASAAR